MSFKLPSVFIHHVEVNEQIGRISVDGSVDGKPATVVIEPGEVPANIKTDDQMLKFLLKRLALVKSPNLAAISIAANINHVKAV